MTDTLTDVLAEARTLAATLTEDGHQLTDEERASATDLVERAKAAAEVERKAAADQAIQAKLSDLLALAPPPAPDGQQLPAGPADVKAPGTGLVVAKKPSDVFLASKQYQQFRADYPAGMPESARVHLPPVAIPGGIKAVLGSGDAGGLGPAPDRVPYPVPPWGYGLVMRDVITVGTTGSDVVEFAQLSTYTSAAAPVAEATDTAGSGTKPESTLVYTKVSAPVRTVAHWLAATKRALSDAGQLRTLIDSFLRYGLDKALENQIINGDGTGENFRGILATTGTQPIAYSTSPIETIRKGITAVQVNGLAQPTAVLLNPADSEAIDLAKDTQQRYYGAGPFGTGPATIWGLPQVVTPELAAGQAIVADFRQAVLWDREATTITASDSHSDFFIRNLVAILAELRAAFGIFRPAAFAICDLTAV